MKKQDMIANVAEKSGLTKADAERAIAAFTGELKSVAAQGDSFTMQGFGTFKGKLRPARNARNPATGESVRVPEKRVLTFSMAKSLTL